MTDSGLVTSTDQAGARVAKNVSVRAGAELVGKLATLVLFAVMARRLGPSGLGVLVFALAYLAIVMTPIGLGTDSFVLFRVARDRAMAAPLLGNVLGLKLALSVPVLLLGLAALWPLGFGAEARATTAVLALAALLDLLARTIYVLFNAVERGELLAGSLVTQRVLTAALGLAVLMAGGGLVAVACAFAVGSAVNLALSWLLLRRFVALPRAQRPAPRTWGPIARRSLPFAAQDVFAVLLFKLDAVVLGLLASAEAVGRYGAAYRLVEATLMVTWAVNGAFAAMYAYLGRDSRPTLAGVFGASLKVALIPLVPVAVVFAVLAEPVTAAVFGARFEDAGAALRLLAPVVFLLAVVQLTASMVASRDRAVDIMRLTAVMVAVNLALNVALIPAHEDRGAAAAMLGTELLFAVAALILAQRLAGRIAWSAAFIGPLAAGALMAAATVALRERPVLAGLAGAVVYVVAVTAIERRTNPEHLRLLVRVLAGPISARGRAAPSDDDARAGPT